MADRAPTPAARATRWGRCSPRSRRTTPGSRRFGAISRRRARTCKRRAVHAAERQGPAQGQPARRLDDEGRVAVREGARHPAAAALRARLHEHRLRAVHVAAARSVRIRARAAGRARSSNAGFTSAQTVQPNNFGPVHQFTISNSGELTVAVTSIVPGSTFLGVEYGQLAGAGCGVLQQNAVSSANPR